LFLFKEKLEELNEELESLNAQARELENIIAQYLPVVVGGLVLILAWLSRQLQLWQLLLLFLIVIGVVIWITFGLAKKYLLTTKK
jgi:Na+/H+-dicarboxylate symporter